MTLRFRRVVDPQEVYGSDFPWGGETFRVLKEKELKVLAAGTLRSLTRRAPSWIIFLTDYQATT